MQSTIVLVEDDDNIREFLVEVLRENRYTVYPEETGIAGLKTVEKVVPSLVILDLGLPDIDGETVCKRIKDSYPDIPVIILTASEDSNDVVSSFDKGADDYVNKPFVNEELLARIKAKLRKQKDNNSDLEVGSLKLNTDTMIVTRGQKEIELTQTEFELLHYLMVNANRVLSREQILGHVWAQDPDIETRVVDVYIGYLRKKIKDKEDNKLIHSKRGFGYVMRS